MFVLTPLSTQDKTATTSKTTESRRRQGVVRAVKGALTVWKIINGTPGMTENICGEVTSD